ncbi:hypothetical protein PR001_g33358 [Phytophthora rubi]|uniref:DDE-1 domain-containing protein n=1 Tax=Phytophthora rubi TaxID=129364 RepID=A0A6A3GEB7_9STRA|nr:hypothetical protein PR001_g33358 [Phytophthora rubi]
MQWSQELWKTTRASTIAHCWQKTGLAVPLRGIAEPDAEDDVVQTEDCDEDVVDVMLRVASIQF